PREAARDGARRPRPRRERGARGSGGGRARDGRRGDAAPGRPLAAPGPGGAGAPRRAPRDQRPRRGDEPAARAGRPAARGPRVPPAPGPRHRPARRRRGDRGELSPVSDRAVATSTLLDALPDKTVLGAPPARVTGLAYDSRKATPGSLFVAIPGFKQDGRRF